MWVREKLDKAWNIFKTKGLGELAVQSSYYIREKRDIVIWELYHFLHKTRLVNLDGYKLLLHSEDTGISIELALYKSHEPQTTTILKDVLKPGFTVVDIGSNIGYYAILESLIVGKSGKIIAIEPEPRNYALLLRNLEINATDNVITYPLAIGSEDGTGKLFVTKQSNLNSMLKPAKADKLIDVEVRSLDSLLESCKLQRVDLIRMDIEGFESVVIKGMLSTLKTFHPRLLIELHPSEAGYSTIRDLLIRLKDLNYEVEYVINRDEDFKWRKHRHGVKSFSINELINKLEEYRVVMVFFTPSRK